MLESIVVSHSTTLSHPESVFDISVFLLEALSVTLIVPPEYPEEIDIPEFDMLIPLLPDAQVSILIQVLDMLISSFQVMFVSILVAHPVNKSARARNQFIVNIAFIKS